MTDKTQNNHIALYTKYRPQKFAEVLGQEHITDLLSQSIKSGKISHAYVFTGTRGTGKTSVARIFAREIGTTTNDLYEIDAASNTGVDNIRELTESINTLPFNSKYKVYILDEAHMLSKSSFNALLKTLEEPPAHVIFILATTEPHKIPETVISRCEVYNFKTPNREILKNMIKKTAKSEGLNLSAGASELIAILGDGSFRDTHTILQKILRTESIVSDREISIEEIEKATGAPKNALINKIIESFATGDLVSGLAVIKNAVEDNLDAKIFLNLLLQKFRVLLMLKIVPNNKDLYQQSVSTDDLVFLESVLAKNADRINSANLSKLIDVVNESGRCFLPFLPLEIFLVEILGE